MTLPWRGSQSDVDPAREHSQPYSAETCEGDSYQYVFINFVKGSNFSSSVFTYMILGVERGKFNKHPVPRYSTTINKGKNWSLNWRTVSIFNHSRLRVAETKDIKCNWNKAARFPVWGRRARKELFSGFHNLTVTGIFPKHIVPIADTPEQHGKKVSRAKDELHVTNPTVSHTTQKYFISKRMNWTDEWSSQHPNQGNKGDWEHSETFNARIWEF